jgi:hypothetical protein
MRDHIRREAADISAAWFVVPMSVAAAVLIAMTTQSNEPEAAPATPLPAATAAPATALPVPDTWPEATEHVQAF